MYPNETEENRMQLTVRVQALENSFLREKNDPLESSSHTPSAVLVGKKIKYPVVSLLCSSSQKSVYIAGRKQAPNLTSLETGLKTVLKNEHFPLKYEMKNSQGKMGHG